MIADDDPNTRAIMVGGSVHIDLHNVGGRRAPIVGRGNVKKGA